MPLRIVHFSTIQEGTHNSNLRILCVVNEAMKASILSEIKIWKHYVKLSKKKHYAMYTVENMEENESVFYKCETENEKRRVAERGGVRVEGV